MKAISPKNPEQTRQQLLEAAFEEIHEHGFQAASLERILGNTQLTKGALYHHFPNKHALGLAVVDEVIAREINECRIAPLFEVEDPLQAILLAAQKEVGALTEHEKELGCPLNNLVQEMSPLDTDFKRHLAAILQHWQRAMADALRGGQQRGFVRTDVDCDEVAWFVLAIYSGTISLSKVQDHDFLTGIAFRQAQFYLSNLRP